MNFTMNSQKTKIREVNGTKYTGLTDLEWAKIKVSAARYGVVHELYCDDYNTHGEANRPQMELAYAEHIFDVEEVLSNGGRKVESNEAEVTVLKSDLVSIVDSLVSGSLYLPDHVKFHINMSVQKLREISGVFRMPRNENVGGAE